MPKFEAGDFVRHVLSKDKGIVLEPLETRQPGLYCYIVRFFRKGSHATLNTNGSYGQVGNFEGQGKLIRLVCKDFELEKLEEK